MKLEEYREISDYWSRIFVTGTGNVIRVKIKGNYWLPHEVAIVFSNGYTPNRRQMLVQISGISKAAGIVKWGAQFNKEYFNIRLGQILATHNCTIPMITLEKIAEVSDPVHPGNIEVGFTIQGTLHEDPQIGCRFCVGPTWSTSVVTEIIDAETFRTLNSIYRITKLTE
jgi:hypothetical protein